MQAKNVMTRDVAALSVDLSLADAARVMWECHCGFVPILDEVGGVCGVLTDRDVCMGAFTQDRPLGLIPISASMSRSVATCLPDDDVETVERIMRERRVRRLPVVDENRQLMGILALDDLARMALDPDLGVERHAFREEVARTLALVSAPSPADTLRDVCKR